MTRRLISNKALWGMHVSQGRANVICGWLGANGIDYRDVTFGHDLTVEDGPNHRVIRYRAYLRALDGCKYHEDGVGPATEERTVPLVVEPPDDWPVYALTGTPGRIAT